MRATRLKFTIRRVNPASTRQRGEALLFADRPARNVGDRFRGHAVFLEQRVGFAGFAEGVLGPDADHHHRIMLRQHLRHRAAQTTVDGMLFRGHDAAGSFRLGDDGFLVDRLDCVHVDDGRGDAFPLQHVARFQRHTDHDDAPRRCAACAPCRSKRAPGSCLSNAGKPTG